MAPLPDSLKKSIAEQFELSPETLRKITDQIKKEFEDGLSREGVDMAMIPTFVSGVPNGSETGTFLALDLGGTNLRVCEVVLSPEPHKFTIKQEKYAVASSLKTGPAADLFDYIAKSIGDFLAKSESGIPEDEMLHLGFTFSFPVHQTALDRGTLLTWTKGFSCPDAPGKDVVKLLQDALDRAKLNVRVSALVNDTVGTLLARGYQSGTAQIGAIFGTGTNGAYVEKHSSITKMSSSARSAPDAADTMIVNTEWGASDNGRHALPVTEWDDKLDAASINPRKQAFEKMISGMYLGEILRHLLLSLQSSQHFLASPPSQPTTLSEQYGLDTALLSTIEGSADLAGAREVLQKEFGVEKPTDEDAGVLKWAAELVGQRAAALSACAVAAIVERTGAVRGTEEIGLGVDGSVVEFYPYFEPRLRAALTSLVGEAAQKRVNIGLAKDGSGVGAALCALQAKKQEESGDKVAV